jgi:hypothetical protein
MKTIAMTRMAGSLDERARASTTPSGNPSAKPIADNRNESGSPLQSVVGTGLNPSTPPPMSTATATSVAAHNVNSLELQKRGIIEIASAAANRPIATITRQCSS